MKKLLFSIHDVTPRHFERLQRIDRILTESGIGASYAMLVVPDFWKEWPLDADGGFGDWLREKANSGVEMLLHGYYHLDDTPPKSMGAKFKAAYMTASEGEFLSLERDAARERILRGRDMLEKLLKRQVNGFVAPAWLYSDATKEVLGDLGFMTAEDHLRVWSPMSHEQLAFSPVVSYASRSPARIASSLFWSRLATTVLSGFDVVRLALHPHDLDVSSLETEFVRVLHRWIKERQPVRYRELAAA